MTSQNYLSYFAIRNRIGMLEGMMFGMSSGICFGCVAGIFLSKIAICVGLGFSIGLALGMCIGMSIKKNNDKKVKINPGRTGKSKWKSQGKAIVYV